MLRYIELSKINNAKFIMNSGEVEVGDQDIKVKLKKKKNLPQFLSDYEQFCFAEIFMGR